MEHGLAVLKFLACVVAAVGQIRGLGDAVVDGKIVQIFEVLHILAGELGRALGPHIALLLVVVFEVRHVARKAPAAGRIHIAGRERVNAGLVRFRFDRLDKILQRFKILDVFERAELIQQVEVDDNAVALVAVADRNKLAVLVIDIVRIGVQLGLDGGAGQIQRVIRPIARGGGIADNKQRRRRGFVHLGGQLLVIGAGRGGNHLDGNAGFRGVHFGNLLQHRIGFRLEVQPVYRAGRAVGGRIAAVGSRRALRGGAGRGGAGRGAAAAAVGAAAQQGQSQDDAKCKCPKLFAHFFSS